MSNATNDKISYDTGDTAWMLTSTAFVLFQAFGLAIFYGSLIRPEFKHKTLLETIFTIGVIPIQWVVFGYSFAFANDGSSFFGTFQYAGLKDIADWREFSGDREQLSPTVPASVFVAFQLSFAILTASLLTGCFTGKVKLHSLVIFSFMWTTIVYDAVAHWVWSPSGWIFELGSLDFAGGSVVHICSGFSALAGTIVLYMDKKKTPAMDAPSQFENLLGAGILWFGWFGFNGGSALASNQIAGVAFLNTLLCPAAAMFFWMVCELVYTRVRTGHADCALDGPLFAVVCGLVVITPGAGYIEPGFALLMGVYTGPLAFLLLWGWKLLARRLVFLDDGLYVFVSHGLCGIVGSFSTGLFATSSINPAVEGAFYGNGVQVAKQLADISAVAAWSFVVTAILMLAIKFTIGLAPDHDDNDDIDVAEASVAKPSEVGQFKKQPTLGNLFDSGQTPRARSSTNREQA